MRLRDIGYSNHTPCIVGLPTMTNEESKHLVKCLVGLRHKFTRNSTTLWDQGLLELARRKLSLRGSIPDPWTSRCNLFSEFDNDRVGQRLARVSVPAAPNPTEVSLKCPVCLHMQDCTHTSLVKGAVWKPVQCKLRHCRATRSSAKWTCTCNKLWYTCDIHALSGHSAGRHCNRPPNASELVTPVEPLSKKRKVDGCIGPGLLNSNVSPSPHNATNKRIRETNSDSQSDSPPAVRIRLQPSFVSTNQEERKNSYQTVPLSLEPKRQAMRLCATFAVQVQAPLTPFGICPSLALFPLRPELAFRNSRRSEGISRMRQRHRLEFIKSGE